MWYYGQTQNLNNKQVVSTLYFSLSLFHAIEQKMETFFA